MRSSLPLISVLLVLMVFSGCTEKKEVSSSQSYAGSELKVAGFGGTTQRQMQVLAGQIFENLTGAQVKFIRGTSRLHLETLEKANGVNPPFDVVLLDGIIQQIASRKGLLHKSTVDDIPLIEELVPQAKPRVVGGPAFQFFSVGIAYDPAALDEADVPDPSSWSDFWRPELRGHVAVPSVYHASGIDFIQAAARKAGGSPETLEGLKKGIDAIAELKPAMIYRSVKKLKEAIEEEKIWIVPLYNSRAHSWIGQHMRLAFTHPKEKGFGHLTTINVTKGTKNKKLAEMFINLVLTQGYQYAQAIETPYGPVHNQVIDPLAHYPKVVERFPLGQEGLADLYVANWELINSLRPEVEKYWFSKFPDKD